MLRPVRFDGATRCAAIAGAVAAALASASAQAQVATLGKGHTLLVNSGLQIWGCDTGASDFTYSNLTNANMNGVMWSFGQAKANLLSSGQKWGKWVSVEDEDGNFLGPDTALTSVENAHYADLLAIQIGDEQGDLENPNGPTKAWFDAARNGNYFNDRLLYVNHFGINNVSNFISFVAAANPDALSFDSYPFGNPSGFSTYNWLGKAQGYRRVALGSYIGASGTAPRPYGFYLQSYTGSDATRAPGDVEMRWQQFTAWTMGYTFVDAFTVGGGTSLFNGGNMSSPAQPRYDQFKESARQGRNLGPALTKLISHGYGPSMVRGKNSAGVTNALPIDWLDFDKSQAPTNQQFLTGLSAANPGTKNDGQPGDVYVGFFNPLHASFGEAGDVYFMVTNALGAYLDDPTATVTDTQQQITMDFDTQYSGVSTLQRLRRSDGQIEIVPLTRTAGRQYQHQWMLEGGTGDLFKYNDGSQFVGFNTQLHWDNDANAAGNNTGTGAGLGGGGTWDGGSGRWYNGSANGAWAGNRDAVFTGTPGTVTLSAPQSVTSLTFKSNGYALSGSTVTMAGQHITTESGVTTTINSNIAGTGGIVKAGPGTLVITNNSNTVTGGTAVTGGVLQISADGAMGPAPATFMGGDIILNGGTLKSGASFDIANNRGIDIGAGGGAIDTQGFNIGFATPDGMKGGIRGPGDLTKIGSGTFFASSLAVAGPNGTFNDSWKGRLILKEGVWKILTTNGLPYNAPLADGIQAGQVTLDGGALEIGATITVTNGRRGITITGNGGTIDTPGFDLTWAGPMAGTSTTSTLTKTGSGLLRFTGANGVAGTYNGNVNINGGTLHLDAGITMGDLASINLANVAGATLNVTGNETIGSLAGGGGAGGNVTLNPSAGTITLTTGGNDKSTTLGGAISGASGNLAKNGTGTMTLNGANTYGGTTAVNAGTLLVNGTHTGAGNYTIAAGATLGGTGSITLKNAATSVTVNGVLSPGASIESLNLNAGDLTLGSGSTSNFEIDLATGAFDQVTVGDLLTYGGTLNVTFTGSDLDGGTFQLFTLGSGGQTGDFSAVAFSGLAPSQTASFDKTTGLLTVAAVPEPTVLSLLPLAALMMRRRRHR